MRPKKTIKTFHNSGSVSDPQAVTVLPAVNGWGRVGELSPVSSAL